MILNDDDNTEDNDLKDEATEIEQNNVSKHVDDPGDDIDESINMPLISLTEKDETLIQTTELIEKMNWILIQTTELIAGENMMRLEITSISM